ncbi:hypothetical protein U1Q18_039684, partial [Sarracenia purpurea var. burkii]
GKWGDLRERYVKENRVRVARVRSDLRREKTAEEAGSGEGIAAVIAGEAPPIVVVSGGGRSYEYCDGQCAFRSLE